MNLNVLNNHKLYKYLRTALICVQMFSMLYGVRKTMLSITKFPLVFGIILSSGLSHDIYEYYSNKNHIKFNLDSSWFCIGLLATTTIFYSPNRTVGFINCSSLLKPVLSSNVNDISDVFTTAICASSIILAQLPIPYVIPIIFSAYNTANYYNAYQSIFNLSNKQNPYEKIGDLGVNFVTTIFTPLSAIASIAKKSETLKPKIEWLCEKASRFTKMRSCNIDEGFGK